MYSKKIAFSFFTVPVLGNDSSFIFSSYPNLTATYSILPARLRVPDASQARKGK